MFEKFLRTIAVIIGVSLSLTGDAQYSSIKIKSPDSLGFKLFVNGNGQNDEWKAEVFADSIRHGNVPIEILLADSVTRIQLELVLERATAHVFELRKLGTDYTVLPFSKSPKSSEALPKIEDSSIELMGDSTSTDSSLIQYNGPTGCSGIVSRQKIESWSAALKSEIFESSRMKIINKHLDTHCLTVSQFAELLQWIELEDYRLELASNAAKSLYDLQNFMDLEDIFQLSNSREALKKIYESELGEN